MKPLALWILLLLILFAAPLAFGRTAAPLPDVAAVASVAAPQSSQPQSGVPDDAASQAPEQASEKKVTAYTLPPDLYRKARDLGRFHARFAWIDFFYGIFVLWVILYWRFGPQFRDWAESASRNRFLQAAIFAPLLTLDDGHSQSALGHLRKFRRAKIRPQHSELGLLVLGLDERTVSRNPAGNYFGFDSLRRHTQQPATLVVLFLADFVAHHRASRLHSAGDLDPMFHKFDPLQKKILRSLPAWKKWCSARERIFLLSACSGWVREKKPRS